MCESRMGNGLTVSDSRKNCWICVVVNKYTWLMVNIFTMLIVCSKSMLNSKQLTIYISQWSKRCSISQYYPFLSSQWLTVRVYSDFGQPTDSAFRFQNWLKRNRHPLLPQGGWQHDETPIRYNQISLVYLSTLGLHLCRSGGTCPKFATSKLSCLDRRRYRQPWFTSEFTSYEPLRLPWFTSTNG